MRPEHTSMELDLLLFARFYSVWVLGLVVCEMVLAIYGRLDWLASISLWLPAATAAQDLGRKHGKRARAALPKGAAWKYALPMTAVAICIQALVAALKAAVLPIWGLSASAVFAMLPPLYWLLSLVFYVSLIYLTIRIFLPSGVRHGMKLAQLEANKS